MSRTAIVLAWLVAIPLSAAGCYFPDPAARSMIMEVADSLAAYGERIYDYEVALHTAVCNLDQSIWDPYINPDPNNPTVTLIKPRLPPATNALCYDLERGTPPDPPGGRFESVSLVGTGMGSS